MGTKQKDEKVPITKRALVQRINRHLRNRNEALRGKRGANTGEYYLVDFTRNALIQDGVSIDKLGRELNVLKPYERLED
jgi:hypothetical protein